jgi:hypothetical protein
MAELFDEVSRVIGSEIPRRQALKLIIKVLSGGALTLIMPAPLYAVRSAGCMLDTDCPAGQICCNSSSAPLANQGKCYTQSPQLGCCSSNHMCATSMDKNTCEQCEGGTFFGTTHTCRNGVCVGPSCYADSDCPTGWSCCTSNLGLIGGTCYRKAQVFGCCWVEGVFCNPNMDTSTCLKCYGGQHVAGGNYVCRDQDHRCVPANPTPTRPW